MKPLIVFVHVPKTAGSTVNYYLSQVMPNGISHCEAIMQDDNALRRAANECDWLSGHVEYCDFMLRLAAVTDRPLRLFTCVRDPFEQVMSHYNWLIEIFHRGEQFYNTHPKHVKEISERIRATDNSKPENIEKNLLKNPNLFLNMQSRLVLGRRFAWWKGEIYQRLDEYEFIGSNANLKTLIEKMTGAVVDDVRSVNKSGYHFPREAFDNPQMRRFFKYNNTWDELIVDIVAKEYRDGPLSPSS